MSAFLCSDDHFIALGVFASRCVDGIGIIRVDPRFLEGTTQEQRDLFGRELASFYANVLKAENNRSLAARYEDGRMEEHTLIDVSDAQENDSRYQLNPVAILKMCDCLEYRSCETSDYRTTAAWNLLSLIRDAAVRSLPGYDDAPWDYVAPPVSPRANCFRVPQ